jgi:hypothetical protein
VHPGAHPGPVSRQGGGVNGGFGVGETHEPHGVWTGDAAIAAARRFARAPAPVVGGETLGAPPEQAAVPNNIALKSAQ